jgi:hypothetical protein
MLSVALAGPAAAAQEIIETDLCLYGGTSGGLAAAVQAARMGQRVVIVEPSRHLGGMSSSGLGVTDKGRFTGYIGGLAAEFYRRLGTKYGQANKLIWQHEPSKASAVFADWLSETGVRVLREQELSAVRKTGPRITEIETAGGIIVRAAMFGVSFTVGREANAQYGETLNGVGNPSAGTGFNLLNVDPYRTPGNPLSGLCRHVQAVTLAPSGSADNLVQAYNFRLCLTDVAANRRPLDPPADYDPAEFEVLGRHVAARVANGNAVSLGGLNDGLIHVQRLAAPAPNGKTDINANAGLSSDYVGASYSWPTATYAQRRVIQAEHERYYRSLLHFLRTDARIPLAIRTEAATWGLPLDEFPETNGWPPQLYVREARRMIGNYVMTEQNGRGTRIAPQPIGLAAYALDSHYVQRVVKSGRVTNEGGFFVTPDRPYPIALASLLPQPAECENLFATFALSATHAAFSSLRMEPVFMITSQSAAAAAVLASRQNVPIQQVAVADVQAFLRSQGQVLEWAGGLAGEGVVVEAEGPGGTPTTGSWSESANAGFHGTASMVVSGGTGAARTFTFIPKVPAAGQYRVDLWWVAASNRSTALTVKVTANGTTTSHSVNQTLNGSRWNEIGTFTFAAGLGESIVLEHSSTSSAVFANADAVRLVPVDPTILPTTVRFVPLDPTMQEGLAPAGRVLAVREGFLSSALTVPLTAGGTAGAADVAVLPASVTFAIGEAVKAIDLTAAADALSEPEETLTLTLSAGAGYTVASPATATFTLAENPWEAWRRARFSSAQLSDPQVSGPLGDADFDGLVNAVEFALGRVPLTPDAGPGLTPEIVGDRVHLTWHRATWPTKAPPGAKPGPSHCLLRPANGGCWCWCRNA